MRISIALISTLALLVSCGQTPAERCKETREKLEAMRREMQADLVRQRAECQAQAIELAGVPGAVESCLESYRTLATASQTTQENIARRYSDPDMQECARLGVTRQH